MRGEVESRFRAIFHETINDQVEPGDELSADDVDGWTSLTHINLIYAIEDEFGFELTQEEMSGLRNLGQLRRLVLMRTVGEST